MNLRQLTLQDCDMSTWLRCHPVCGSSNRAELRHFIPLMQRPSACSGPAPSDNVSLVAVSTSSSSSSCHRISRYVNQTSGCSPKQRTAQGRGAWCRSTDIGCAGAPGGAVSRAYNAGWSSASSSSLWIRTAMHALVPPLLSSFTNQSGPCSCGWGRQGSTGLAIPDS